MFGRSLLEACCERVPRRTADGRTRPPRDQGPRADAENWQRRYLTRVGPPAQLSRFPLSTMAVTTTPTIDGECLIAVDLGWHAASPLLNSPPVRRRSPVRPVPAKLSSPLLAELPRAQVVVGPGNPRVTDPRRVHRHRGLQHCLDHRPLCHRIADGAEREPERVGHEAGA